MGSGGFWSMGGYAAFVWPAYGVTLLGLLALLVGAWRGLRGAERRLAEAEQARPRRRSAAARAEPAAGDLA